MITSCPGVAPFGDGRSERYAHRASNIFAEMTQDQYERTGIVVDDGSGLGSAEQRKIVFEIGGPTAARTLGEIILEVVIFRSDP